MQLAGSQFQSAHSNQATPNVTKIPRLALGASSNSLIKRKIFAYRPKGDISPSK
jgi:hypothetical protein